MDSDLSAVRRRGVEQDFKVSAVGETDPLADLATLRDPILLSRLGTIHDSNAICCLRSCGLGMGGINPEYDIGWCKSRL